MDGAAKNLKAMTKTSHLFWLSFNFEEVQMKNLLIFFCFNYKSIIFVLNVIFVILHDVPSQIIRNKLCAS